MVIETVPGVLEMKIDISGPSRCTGTAGLHHRDELVVAALESDARQHEKELPRL